jgi:CTP:molybdopterin cytidylyltransferase MocA
MMVGVLLAAGASRRMRSPKPLARSRGASFLAHGIRHLWSACEVVVVVLGSKAREVRAEVEREFERLVATGALHRDLDRAERTRRRGLEVCFVVHRGWKQGMYSSARAGLKRALGFKPDAVLVLPVDQPSLKPATVRDLATVMRLALAACRSRADRARFSYALVPRCRRRRGHPLLLSEALARAVSGDGAAANLGDAVRRHARLVGFLDVADRGVVANRNTPRG